MSLLLSLYSLTSVVCTQILSPSLLQKVLSLKDDAFCSFVKAPAGLAKVVTFLHLKGPPFILNLLLFLIALYNNLFPM